MQQFDPRFERTRALVRQAAISILTKEGSHALTHQRVAERAKVGRATVYRHWPDRWALMREGMDALSLTILPREGLSLEENLVQMLESLCDQLESPAAVALITIVTEAETSVQARELRDGIAKNALKIMAAVVSGDNPGMMGMEDENLLKRLTELVGVFFFERFFLGSIASRDCIVTRVNAFLDLL